MAEPTTSRAVVVYVEPEDVARPLTADERAMRTILILAAVILLAGLGGISLGLLL